MTLPQRFQNRVQTRQTWSSQPAHRLPAHSRSVQRQSQRHAGEPEARWPTRTCREPRWLFPQRVLPFGRKWRGAIPGRRRKDVSSRKPSAGRILIDTQSQTWCVIQSWQDGQVTIEKQAQGASSLSKQTGAAATTSRSPAEFRITTAAVEWAWTLSGTSRYLNAFLLPIPRRNSEITNRRRSLCTV